MREEGINGRYVSRRRWRRWSSLAALIFLTSCNGSSTPRSGLIAFTSRRDGWFSIYTVKPDGSGPHKLTDIVSVENGPSSGWLDALGQPAWSADGTKVAFTCPYQGQSEICSVNADGSGAVVVANSPGGPDRYPAWSPDGRIAFTLFIDESHADIVVVNSDGTAELRLTTGFLDYGPTWSPDGSQIAFIRDDGDQSDIYLMSSDGSRVHDITNTSVSEATVAWSPDGSSLAYVIGAQGQDIYIMDVDGSNKRNLTQSSDDEAWPTWSPDGKELAFMCPHSSICVISADGTGRRQIIPGNELNMQPAWQPLVSAASR